jgi:hypothetical protein
MFENRWLRRIFGCKGEKVLDNYHYIEERKPVRHSDLESYAGESVSSW